MLGMTTGYVDLVLVVDLDVNIDGDGDVNLAAHH